MWQLPPLKSVTRGAKAWPPPRDTPTVPRLAYAVPGPPARSARHGRRVPGQVHRPTAGYPPADVTGRPPAPPGTSPRRAGGRGVRGVVLSRRPVGIQQWAGERARALVHAVGHGPDPVDRHA